MTAGLTYWRCPECGWVPPAVYVNVPDSVAEHCWDLLPITAARCERMVEAHEAKHLGGAA